MRRYSARRRASSSAASSGPRSASSASSSGKSARAFSSSSAATRTRNSPQASRSSVVALGQPLDERDDDRGDVDLGEVELLAQDERQEQVERPLEGVQIQLELAHDHRRAG